MTATVTPLAHSVRLPDNIARMKGEPTALAALAAGATIEAAAEAAGVSPRTVYRRLADTGYAAEVDRHREAAIGRALGRLASASSAAVETLVELADGAESESVRLKAADRIVSHVVALHDHLAVSSRLEELEEQLAALLAERDAHARPAPTVSPAWRFHAR